MPYKSRFVVEARKTYTDDEKDKIWAKARTGTNSETGQTGTGWAFDAYGALMSYEEYGNRDSNFGWEIDHRDETPDNDALSNLRPLFWGNNCARNAENPSYYKYNKKSKKNER